MRITAGYHHGFVEGDIIRLGRKFVRVTNVGVEAFNYEALPWHVSACYMLRHLWRRFWKKITNPCS